MEAYQTSIRKDRLSGGNIVTEKRGYSSAGAAEARPNPRVTSPAPRRSFRGSIKGSFKGSMSLKKTPSLIFAEANSESDDLTSCGFSDPRPKRQCSFVNRGEVPPEIMDLRMVDSAHGSGKRSYELSVCSVNSIETGDERMDMFEVTLPSSLKISSATGKKEVEVSTKLDGEEQSKGLIHALTAKRRLSMETIWSAKKSVHPGPSTSPPTVPKDQELSDPSVTKSPRKSQLRRCVQAAAIFVLLATFVVFPWAVIAYYFGAEDADPSSLISSLTNKIPVILEGIFDPRDEMEVQREPVVGAPPIIPPGSMNRRHLGALEESGSLRYKRLTDRQAEIKDEEDPSSSWVDRIGKDTMIPQDSEDVSDQDLMF